MRNLRLRGMKMESSHSVCSNSFSSVRCSLETALRLSIGSALFSCGATKGRKRCCRSGRRIFCGLCRQSKCAVVNLSQSIPAYVSRIGGDNPRDAALSLAGKFGNHVFCSNSDPETNEFASKMLGRVITRHSNYSSGRSQNFNMGMSAGYSQGSGDSSSYSMGQGIAHSTGNNSSNGNNWGDSRGRGNSDSVNRGYSESLEYAIEPGDFARSLKTGGPQNGNRVSAVVVSDGPRFQSDRHKFLNSGVSTMTRPRWGVRLVGKPYVCIPLIAFYGLLVWGWYQGNVRWWVGLLALGGAEHAFRCYKQRKNYNVWLAQWNDMLDDGERRAPPAGGRPCPFIQDAAVIALLADGLRHRRGRRADSVACRLLDALRCARLGVASSMRLYWRAGRARHVQAQSATQRNFKKSG